MIVTEFWLLLWKAPGSSTKIFKDTERENALSNNIPAHTKSMNMGIWVVGTSDQLFIRGS